MGNALFATGLQKKWRKSVRIFSVGAQLVGAGGQTGRTESSAPTVKREGASESAGLTAKNPRRRGCVWGRRGGRGCGGGGRSGSGGSGGRWGRCRRTGRPSFHRQFSPRTGNRYSSGRSSFGTAWGSSLSLMFAPIIHAFRANCYGTFCEKAAGSPSTAAKTPLPPFPGLACRKRRRRASFPRAAAARR